MRLVGALVLTLLFVELTQATVVIPPTFDELVSRSRSIVVVEAVDQRAEWRAGVIVTHVTFRVLDVWKGDAASQIVLTFAGGTVGDRTLRIDGIPEFEPRARDILFVDPAEGASPLIGFMHGRFRVVDDRASGVQRVLTFDGRPLIATEALGRAVPPSLDQRLFRALSVDEFRGRVSDALMGLP